jgi:hypothetical protein
MTTLAMPNVTLCVIARITSISAARGRTRNASSAGMSIVQLRKRLRRYVATMVHVSTESADPRGARYELYARRC